MRANERRMEAVVAINQSKHQSIKREHGYEKRIRAVSYAIRQPPSTAQQPIVHFYIDGGEDDESKLASWRHLSAGDLRIGYETAVHTHTEKQLPCNADCEVYVLMWREEFSNIVQILRAKQ